MDESRLPPDKPNPTSADIKPAESVVYGQHQALKNGTASTVLFYIIGLTFFRLRNPIFYARAGISNFAVPTRVPFLPR